MEAQMPHPDVVRAQSPSPERYLRLNDMVGESVAVTMPGDVITDSEGTPTAVEPDWNGEALVLGVIVTKHELAAVGLTPNDVPNLRVIDVLACDDGVLADDDNGGNDD